MRALLSSRVQPCNKLHAALDLLHPLAGGDCGDGSTEDICCDVVDGGVVAVNNKVSRREAAATSVLRSRVVVLLAAAGSNGRHIALG